MSPDTLRSGPPDPALEARLRSVIAEGRQIWERFDSQVRRRDWHPFVPADYDRVLEALVAVRAPGLRFLEWGSATGVITILADLLGLEAYGIELDPELVEMARGLAARHGSGARFAAGSFVPAGYRWQPAGGDDRMGTIGDGASAYAALDHPLDHFDLVFAYPWTGEEPVMRDLMRSRGRGDARLLLFGPEGVRIFSGDRLQAPDPAPGG